MMKITAKQMRITSPVYPYIELSPGIRALAVRLDVEIAVIASLVCTVVTWSSWVSAPALVVLLFSFSTSGGLLLEEVPNW